MKVKIHRLLIAVAFVLISFSLIIYSNPGIFSPVFEGLIQVGIYPDSLEPIHNAAALHKERMQERVQDVEQYWQAAMTLRDGMMERRTAIEVEFTLQQGDDLTAIANAIYEAAFTYDPSLSAAGDYLRQHVRSIIYQEKLYEGNRVEIVYTVTAYLSTAKQEAYVDRMVPYILDALFPENEMWSHDEKIDRIYEFVCENLTYSNSSELSAGSAYSGLADQEATCNGYATLIYRLLLESGIKCRIITGYYRDEFHAWNLILTSAGWRNADVTLDDQLPDPLKAIGYREFYLLHSTTFFGHKRDYTFVTPSFLNTYIESM